MPHEVGSSQSHVAEQTPPKQTLDEHSSGVVHGAPRPPPLVEPASHAPVATLQRWPDAQSVSLVQPLGVVPAQEPEACTHWPPRPLTAKHVEPPEQSASLEQFVPQYPSPSG